MLDRVVNGTDNRDRIKALDAEAFSKYTPKNYSGPESVEVKYDKQFEAACLLIAQKSCLKARGMTVLQFYSALDNIEAQIDAELKSLKRTKK